MSTSIKRSLEQRKLSELKRLNGFEFEVFWSLDAPKHLTADKAVDVMKRLHAFCQALPFVRLGDVPSHRSHDKAETMRAVIKLQHAQESGVTEDSSEPPALGYDKALCIPTDLVGFWVQTGRFERIHFELTRHTTYGILRRKLLPPKTSDWSFGGCCLVSFTGDHDNSAFQRYWFLLAVLAEARSMGLTGVVEDPSGMWRNPDKMELVQKLLIDAKR